MILSESVLTESRSARDGQIQNVSHERAEQILSKVKGLMFAMWQGTGTATTEQMAEYFESPIDTVRGAVARHKDEFTLDGLREVKGKELKSLMAIGHDALQLPESTTRLVVWTPRAALRLAMVLRDSPIAKAARTAILDGIEIIPAQQQEMEKLRLQLELAKTQERLFSTTQAIATIHGTEMVALILGKPDAVVLQTEVVKQTVIVDQRGRAVQENDGVGIGYLTKSLGFKTNNQTWAWLESIGYGKNSGKWVEELTAHTNLRLPRDVFRELKRAWSQRKGSRQRLIGES